MLLEVPTEHLPRPPLGQVTYLKRDCVLLLSTTHEVLKAEAPRLDEPMPRGPAESNTALENSIKQSFEAWLKQGERCVLICGFVWGRGDNTHISILLFG